MLLENCPLNSERTAQRYLEGKLAPREKAAFEEHFLSCPRCSDRLQFTRHFVLAFQRTAERLRVRSAAGA